MKDRIEIDCLDNGYTVTVWKNNDEDGAETMYPEPKKLVAATVEEVMALVKKHLK